MRLNTESTFGDLLRRLRSDAGLTQEQLAEGAGLSVRAISDLERGVNRYPYRATVESLTRALGLESAAAEALWTRAQRRRGPQKTRVGARAALPVPPTSILGREREVGLVLHLIRWEGIRLVTLTGAGGVGKTRLAQEITQELENDFAGGCAFVSLAAVGGAELVPSAIAVMLGIQPAGGSTVEESLLGSIRDQELFLVLDNFEHVVTAATLVSDLLAGCPTLKVLVTSRELLRLRGEHEINVSPLPVPDPDRLPRLEDLRRVPSVALFVQRARAVRSTFELSDNAMAVAEICRRLDGLPLALELAAAQLRHLSPQTLLEQMTRRLDVLGPGHRDSPARQQTMRAAIAWSYDLLDPREQALFRCLAVCPGSGDVEAVETVGGAVGVEAGYVSTGLAQLADKSMLTLDTVDGHRPRFRVLETVREFAWDRLEAAGEGAKARAAHASYFLHLAEEAYPELTAEGADFWLRRLDAEFDNLRAALRWYVDAAQTADGLRLAGALWRLWLWRGLFEEGRQWLEPMLEDVLGAGAPRQARARALLASGVIAYHQNDWRTAESRYEQALGLLRVSPDENGLGDVLNAMGILATQKNQYRRAEGFLQEAAALARAGGRPFALGRALINLAELAVLRGDLDRAASLYDESMETYHAIGDPVGVRITTSVNLSRLRCLQGQYSRARELGLTCLELAQGTNPWARADAMDSLGSIALAEGDLESAEVRYQEALALFEALEAPGGAALVLVHLANLYRARGDYARARSAVARSVRTEEKPDGNARIVVYAHLYLGDVEREEGRLDSAAASYRACLELASRIEYVPGVAECVEHIGWLHTRVSPELTLTLLGAAERIRRRMGMALAPIDEGCHQEAVADLRSRLGSAPFDESWSRGEPMDWRDAASFALVELATSG